VGVNFVVVAATRSTGGLSTDSDLPITDPQLKLEGPILGYARTLDLWDRLGKVDVILPAGELSGSATFAGAPISRKVTGVADPLVRVAVLLYGAPAMTSAEFRSYAQNLVVGASVQVSIPLGQYDQSKLLNLGANRWSIKPELGFSKAWGAWTSELAGSATLYSTNDDFFGGKHRSQQPIYAARANVIYGFRSGMWISLDTTYYTGGLTKLNGVADNDLQRNWRVGTTVAFPIARRHSIKLNVSRGVSARTGNNYDLVGVAWQYRWGAGL
jgi:hypothetical protein